MVITCFSTVTRFLLGCLIFGISLVSYADPICEVTIEADDQIRWDQPVIEVDKACQQFTVNLHHVGQLDKSVMGHSWVLVKAHDKPAVVKLLTFAKDADYVKADPKVLAYTALIGGGEQASVSFETALLEPKTNYVYFCSYPEHGHMMQGELVLVGE